VTNEVAFGVGIDVAGGKNLALGGNYGSTPNRSASTTAGGRSYVVLPSLFIRQHVVLRGESLNSQYGKRRTDLTPH